MCRKTKCSKCNKAAWAGCGNHIEQTLAGVPKSDRCQCEETSPQGVFDSFKKLLSRG